MKHTFDTGFFSIHGVMNKHCVKVLWDFGFVFFWVSRNVQGGSDDISEVILFDLLEGGEFEGNSFEGVESGVGCQGGL